MVTREKLKQVVDQGASARGGEHARQVVAPLFAQGLLILGLQPVAEGLDLAQRLLQVVGGDRGELLQLAVRGVQVRRAAPEGGGHGVKGLIHPADLVLAAERQERRLTLGQALGVLHHGVKTPVIPRLKA